MNTRVSVILPDEVEEGQSYKTLWLLHGLKGDHSWRWWDQQIRLALAYVLEEE